MKTVIQCIALMSIVGGTFGSRDAWGQGSVQLVVRDCLVEAIDDNRLSSAADGILLIDTTKVEEGMLVQQGQVVASIDPEQAHLNLTLKQAEEEQARLEAESDVNILASEKAFDFEYAEAKSAEDLHKKQAMSYWDMRREVLEAERAKLSIEKAKNDKLVAESVFAAKTAERTLAEYEVRRREIKAPFDGVIAMRYGKIGEWVQAGTPIVRVVRIDQLKVEGDIDGLISPDKIVVGTAVSIRVKVAADRFETFKSKLDFVSPILEGDNTYRVWARIDNRQQGKRYVISPGMEAEMSIETE